VEERREEKRGGEGSKISRKRRAKMRQREGVKSRRAKYRIVLWSLEIH
jgi:hypothetical protein